jgi:hypothetical protein
MNIRCVSNKDMVSNKDPTREGPAHVVHDVELTVFVVARACDVGWGRIGNPCVFGSKVRGTIRGGTWM